jgi:HEAT repeat protein
VGVINSIGVRRDAKSIDPLAQKLNDSDPQVAAAAAVSLGKIGGERAASILQQSLTATAPEVRSAAAEGCVLVAEQFLAAGDRPSAVKLYDTVRKADLPKQRILEATRGAILARHADGIPLLVEQLKSQDEAAFRIALRVARELVGGDVTSAVIAELGKAPPERQGLLLLAAADRNDAKAVVLPVALDLLANGSKTVRPVAAGVLETLGDASCVPALVDAAASEDPDLTAAAKTSLGRMRGKDIDAALVSRLQNSTGRMRQVLIELAEGRRLEGAMPIFVQSAQDADAGVRTAALVAIGAIGDDKLMPDLVKLLQNAQDAGHRADIERAVMSVAGRWKEKCLPHLLPLTKAPDPATRVAALRALAGCGGKDALAAVAAAVKDQEQAVQDEAVRTLSTWPNRWPEDAAVTAPLLDLAKSAENKNHRVLALRGYLQFVQGTKRHPNDQRLAKVNSALPLITRPEEKRLAISALAAIANAGTIDPLIAFASDADVAEEAASAIVNLTTGRTAGNFPKDLRKRALQAVAEKSKTESLKKKAQDALKSL